MDFKALYERLRAGFSAAEFEADTRRLYELEKRVCHRDFEVSTAWLADRLREAGFVDVERIAHRCDGVTATYDAVMPQAWVTDLTQIRARIVVKAQKFPDKWGKALEAIDKMIAKAEADAAK